MLVRPPSRTLNLAPMPSYVPGGGVCAVPQIETEAAGF
jgi:hypothetical protein